MLTNTIRARVGSRHCFFYFIQVRKNYRVGGFELGSVGLPEIQHFCSVLANTKHILWATL
jgi:hypothetical protein